VSRGVALVGSTLPGPVVEDATARLFGGHLLLPSQLPQRQGGAAGPTALLAGLLAGALDDAGFGPRRSAPPRTSVAYSRLASRLDSTRRATARAWLVGALDGEVSVPVQLVCDALGIDPAALASVVRRLGCP
jgi:hypothetical protein